MVLKELVNELDRLLRVDLAYDWDNVGLMVGRHDKEIRRILLTLEVSPKVIEEALVHKADLILSHHPFLFRGITSITTADDKGAQIYLAIKNDLAIYSSHTNYDIIERGLNDAVAGLLELDEVQPLTEQDSEDRGIGRIGKLSRAMTIKEFADHVIKKLSLSDVKMVRGNDRPIRQVAVVTGAGVDYLPQAMKKGADVLLTGDVKYHQAQDALLAGHNIIDAGHYGTEIVFNSAIKAFLDKHFEDAFSYIESKELEDPFMLISR